jgi:hypothetical protein
MLIAFLFMQKVAYSFSFLFLFVAFQLGVLKGGSDEDKGNTEERRRWCFFICYYNIMDKKLSKTHFQST